jgi:hypothetical protein
MNPRDEMDSKVAADYPLLRSDGISTDKMDDMIREIIQLLERCSKPESNFSDEERADNSFLIFRIIQIDNLIQASEEEGHEALQLLYRKRLATPDNLGALLLMVDTDIQAGKIRCGAIAILLSIVDKVDFVWSLKMKDGSYFATSYIGACCKALENETNEDCNNHHTERSCECAFNATRSLNMVMLMTKDAPVKVIKCVHSFNWAQILSKAQAKANKFETETEPYHWFIRLYTLCMNDLKENADHSLAREFLQKLEMCHDFLCGALEHVVRMTRSLPSAPKQEIEGLLYRLFLIRKVLWIYSTTLTPPPAVNSSFAYQRTNVLSRLAHHTIKEGRPSVINALQDPTVCQNGFAIEDYDDLLLYTDLLYTDAQQCVGLQTQSEQQRRERFEAALSEHDSDRKTERRAAKERLKRTAKRTFGKDEVCANCHVLESTMEEGETLSKCGWCKQVTYCSRECQKLHWKKAHKKECTGRKK